MDEYFFNQRQSRYRTPRIKRSKIRGRNKIRLNFIMQLSICIVVFLVVWALKKSDSGIGNFVINQVKWVVSKDVSIDNTYASLKNTVAGIFDNDKDTGFDYTDITEDNEDKDAHPAFSSHDESIYKSGQDYKDTEKDTEEDTGVANSTYVSSANIQYEMAVDMPVKGVIISPFGTRLNPLKGVEEFHNGIDIQIENKEGNVYSLLRGTVIDIGRDRERGLYAEVKHGDNTVGIYAHLDEIYVKKGQNLDKNTLIGIIRRPNDINAAFLHFGVMKNGEYIDPIDLLDVTEVSK